MLEHEFLAEVLYCLPRVVQSPQIIITQLVPNLCPHFHVQISDFISCEHETEGSCHHWEDSELLCLIVENLHFSSPVNYRFG